MNEWICRELSTSTGNSENGVLMMETELIRCKDCKFATCIEQKEDWWECKHDKRVNHSDGFCNWAERKEE